MPQDTPAPPDTITAAVSPQRALGAQEEEEEYALGPFARAGNSTQPTSAPTPSAAAGYATGASAVAAAGQARKAAGWAPAVGGSHPQSQLGGGQVVGAKPKGMTSLFNLGYGTNHPKYEAARSRTQGAAQRTMEAAGGRMFQAKDEKQLGLVTQGDRAGKRRREEESSAPKVVVSKEEAEALAKRAAARARVEARTMKTFGLN